MIGGVPREAIPIHAADWFNTKNHADVQRALVRMADRLGNRWHEIHLPRGAARGRR